MDELRLTVIRSLNVSLIKFFVLLRIWLTCLPPKDTLFEGTATLRNGLLAYEQDDLNSLNPAVLSTRQLMAAAMADKPHHTLADSLCHCGWSGFDPYPTHI
jgi:hypothetical protein